jgi:dienelactone hydrolase
MRIVVPAPVAVDDPTTFRVEGATKGGTVAVEATFELSGTAYRSATRLTADADGVADPASTDPFELAWSADPTGPSSRGAYDPVKVLLRVTDEATATVAEASFERLWLRDGASVVEVDDDEAGVHGVYARPGGKGPFPAVVAFGGSGGGLGPAAAWAPLLASRGFAVLAIAYFNAPKLPPHLEEIEVEVVDRAVAWLRQREEVGPAARPIAMGQSRGSELALLAASSFPDRIGGAVVFSASGLVWSALGPQGPMERSAWTLGGEPVPYAAAGAMPAAEPDPDAATELTPLFLELLEGGRTADAVIPVERIDGPILAVSGEDDAMWPSVLLTGVAERRAQERGFRHRFVHLRYPDAGHTAPGPPGTPVVVAVHHGLVDRQMAFGGTRQGSAAARADSWPQVIAFLEEAGRQARRAEP